MHRLFQPVVGPHDQNLPIPATTNLNECDNVRNHLFLRRVVLRIGTLDHVFLRIENTVFARRSWCCLSCDRNTKEISI